MNSWLDITSLDPDRLLLKLSDGKPLTDDELGQIKQILQGFNPRDRHCPYSQDDIYSLVKVIGKAGLRELRQVITGLLDFDDPLTISLVLEIVCLAWDGTEEYLERLLNFALGTAWDEDFDVRHTAIKVLGEHMRGILAPALGSQPKGKKKVTPAPHHLHVLHLLIHIFEDGADDIWSRQVSYYALLRAAGAEWEELPAEGVVLDLAPGSKDIDNEKVQLLKSLVSKSGIEDSESGSFSSGNAPPGTR